MKVETPLQILPHFFCPVCLTHVNVGDCSHRKSYRPPQWINQYNLWKLGKFQPVKSLLERFKWIRRNTEVFSDGLESNDFSAWTSATEQGTGTWDVVGSPVNEGSYAAEIDVATQGANGGFLQKQSISGSLTFYTRFYYQHDAAYGSGSATAKLYQCRTVTPTEISSMWHEANSGTNRWRIWDLAASNDYFEETLTLDQWYSLEVKTFCNASTGEIRLYRDGTEICTLTSLDTGSSNLTEIRVGVAGGAVPAGNHYFDSVIVDDADYIGPIAAGWANNFNGVANASIGKINGVAIASIGKVNGVA